MLLLQSTVVPPFIRPSILQWKVAFLEGTNLVVVLLKSVLLSAMTFCKRGLIREELLHFLLYLHNQWKHRTYLIKNFATGFSVCFNLLSMYSRSTRIILTIAMIRDPKASDPRWYLKYTKDVKKLLHDPRWYLKYTKDVKKLLHDPRWYLKYTKDVKKILHNPRWYLKLYKKCQKIITWSKMIS